MYIRSIRSSAVGDAPSDGCSLYFQWAATPRSATSCISAVRIWISTGRPSGPMTVVWRLW